MVIDESQAVRNMMDKVEAKSDNAATWESLSAYLPMLGPLEMAGRVTHWFKRYYARHKMTTC
jgi:hypothetical protein